MDAPFRALVIGIGNEYRHDDAAGLMVARRLKQHVPQGWLVCEQIGEASVLMQLWEGSERVILIDAVRSGSPCGTVHVFDASVQALPARFSRASTHSFSLVQAVELSRTLGQLPDRFSLFGIEGENFEPGISVSPGVQSGVDKATELIRREMVAG